MPSNQEDLAIGSLTSFSLDHILSGLDIPTQGLSNQLGLTGLSGFSSSQIYSEKWDDGDGFVGRGEGDDFEDEVTRELGEEGSDAEMQDVKMEAVSPILENEMLLDEVTPPPAKKRRKSVDGRKKAKKAAAVAQVVEKPQDVYDLFPSFRKDQILEFSELFKSRQVKRQRVKYKPVQCKTVLSLQPLSR